MNLFLDRQPIFSPDINACEPDLLALVSGARFLVIGGAGSIGQAVVKEIFVRSPAAHMSLTLMRTTLLSWFAIFAVRQAI